MSGIFRVMSDLLFCSSNGIQSFVARDVTGQCAFFITVTPKFQTIPLITYRIDFSDKISFLESVRSVSDFSIMSCDDDQAIYVKNFGHHAGTIIHILNELTDDDRYIRLKVSKQKKIILRDGNGGSVVLENTAKSQDQVMVFDLGTVQRLIEG